MESPPLLNGTNGPYGGYHYTPSNSEMPPPFPNPQSSCFPNQSTFPVNPGPAFADHRSKKMRLSPSMDRFEKYPKSQGMQVNQFVPSNTLLNMGSMISPPSLRYQSSSPSNLGSRVPPTPAASVGSDENYHPVPGPSPQPPPPESADFRRLSVKSLLSDDSPPESTSGSDNIFPGKLNISSHNSSQKTVYGIDRGFPDLDIPKNQDLTALNGVTPTLGTVNLDNTEAEVNNDLFSGFAFGLNTAEGFQEGQGYYSKPVTVSISRSLEPLPAMLKDNPMNLLYFHHFLNHTARILVPHDCSENPFKSILPQSKRSFPLPQQILTQFVVAVQDTHLLNLLLTYSASHRSRLLNHPEPDNRIALWMSDVFPTLSQALGDPSRQITNSNLATAIMLASLQILNPNTFEVSISWQDHLSIARQMITARGGANSVKRKDKVSYFLTRWFAYLDVLGSLSGGKYDQPLFGGNYWAHDHSDQEEDYQIDCLLGFTSRCVSILANIAELARICDGERIDPAGNIKHDWQPSPETIRQAVKLKNDLIEARQHRYQGCPHRRASTQIEDSSYAVELVTTNEAFHHAGFIHVNRRILGRPSTDPEVQCAVREIVSALYKVRKGGTAEGCLLFPMFTAGCDAQEDSQKAKILERLQRMEGLGMSHVKKARALMEKVWETGMPWETLVTGDFFLG